MRIKIEIYNNVCSDVFINVGIVHDLLLVLVNDYIKQRRKKLDSVIVLLNIYFYNMFTMYLIHTKQSTNALSSVLCNTSLATG